jgi:hypothetical protein
VADSTTHSCVKHWPLSEQVWGQWVLSMQSI